MNHMPPLWVQTFAFGCIVYTAFAMLFHMLSGCRP